MGICVNNKEENMKKTSLMLAVVLGAVMLAFFAQAQSLYAADCASHGIDQDKYIPDIRMCVEAVRIRDPGFAAYLDPSTCIIKEHGSPGQQFWRAHTEFKECLRQAGWKID